MVRPGNARVTGDFPEGRRVYPESEVRAPDPIGREVAQLASLRNPGDAV